MDEARAVLARLDRIEELDRRGTPAALMLAEVRSLLTEAEAWVRLERADTSAAENALDRCREAVSGAGSRPNARAGLW
jgi:hypothetical protein